MRHLKMIPTTKCPYLANLADSGRLFSRGCLKGDSIVGGLV